MNLRLVRSASALLIVVGVLVPAGVAAAHTEVVSTRPAAGAILDEAPESVIITFNEELLAASVEASIIGSDGALVTAATPAVDGTVVTIPWPQDQPPGAYEVAYRVASGDGHPVTGSIAFSFAAGSSAASPSASPSEQAPSSPPAGSSSPVPSPAAASEPGQSGGFAVNPFFIGVLLVIAAIVGGVLAVRRRRR